METLIPHVQVTSTEPDLVSFLTKLDWGVKVLIDNHQFGLLTVSLVIIALADTISDFGIANSIIQRKTIGHLEL
ncbi:oligosaccharide flippase family protein, partial [Salmonella enterica subsp. enterica serovar Montevideo]|nr:oligosaccharide flippase family protein [Salmonella enterica subsp. enterica serovar Montevideo]